MRLLWIIIPLLIILFLLYSRIIEPFALPDDPILTQLHSELSTLHPKLENIKVAPGRKSETVDKKRVYICLKDENGEYYDRNMLVYVLCHEYAHVLSNEIITSGTSHTKNFFLILNTLLADAHRRGLYDPSIPPIKDYCGT